MNKIEKLISRRCLDLKVASIEKLGEGDFCRAFLVNETHVFRFAKHEAARQSLKRECRLLPEIADRITLEIPQPNVCFWDGAAAESFIAYRFLPDVSLTPTEYLKLDAKEREACTAQIAGFLRELHSTDLETAEKCGVGRVRYAEKYEGFLNALRGRFAGRLEKTDYDLAVREIERFLASADADSSQPVLLHGDLSPEHVLYNGASVTSIIDFGDVMIGDAAWDFLWLYEDYGPDFFLRTLSKYDPPDSGSFAGRVLRFSGLEAVGWVLECLETGDEDLAEALDNLRSGGNSGFEIKAFFESASQNGR